MGFMEIYKLHLDLVETYKEHKRCNSPFDTQRNYYRDQLLFTKDVAQRVFVLNQIVKLHEKERENLIQWCSETYFKRMSNKNS